jgi:predicted nucleic acid-binding protein
VVLIDQLKGSYPQTSSRLLARRAGELAAEHQLRGYDAVHVASALRLGDQTTLITSDQRLQHAAIATGLAVAPAP